MVFDEGHTPWNKGRKYPCRIQVMVGEKTFIDFCNLAFDKRTRTSTLAREIIENYVKEELENERD